MREHYTLSSKVEYWDREDAEVPALLEEVAEWIRDNGVWIDLLTFIDHGDSISVHVQHNSITHYASKKVPNLAVFTTAELLAELVRREG